MRCRTALLIVPLLFFTNCRKTEDMQPEPPKVYERKLYTVVFEGRVPIQHLEKITEGLNSASYKTREGKRIIFYGSFYAVEE